MLVDLRIHKVMKMFRIKLRLDVEAVVDSNMNSADDFIGRSLRNAVDTLFLKELPYRFKVDDDYEVIEYTPAAENSFYDRHREVDPMFILGLKQADDTALIEWDSVKYIAAFTHCHRGAAFHELPAKYVIVKVLPMLNSLFTEIGDRLTDLERCQIQSYMEGTFEFECPSMCGH